MKKSSNRSVRGWLGFTIVLLIMFATKQLMGFENTLLLLLILIVDKIS
jgi:heme/copper-type cytochrome/quinol oxidase subunit 3